MANLALMENASRPVWISPHHDWSADHGSKRADQHGDRRGVDPGLVLPGDHDTFRPAASDAISTSVPPPGLPTAFEQQHLKPIGVERMDGTEL